MCVLTPILFLFPLPLAGQLDSSRDTHVRGGVYALFFSMDGGRQDCASAQRGQVPTWLRGKEAGITDGARVLRYNSYVSVLGFFQ